MIIENQKLRIILFLFLFCYGVFRLNAQQTFVISHLNPYLSSYVEPFGKAMAVSMSGGWTYTAEVHKTLGFDLSIGASYVEVPASDMFFNPKELDMPGYSFKGKQAPTISSDKDSELPKITKEFVEGIPFGFSIPVLKGLNISYGGMVNIQAGIGLPKGTDLLIRYIPDVSRSTNNLIPYDIELEETGTLGLGLKHNVKQWIPWVKDLPYLEMSLLGSYSRFFTGFSGGEMRLDPEILGVDSNFPESTWDNQELSIVLSSFTGSFLVGGSFKFFQPFVGIGINSSVFDADLLGNFPIVRFSIAHPTGYVHNYEVNPIEAKFKVSNYNYQVGARVKLGFFVINYSLTIQNYLMHSGGIGFTFR